MKARPTPASGRGSLRGWLEASHPWPVTIVVSLTALVALAPAGRDLDLGRLGLLTAAMLTSQLAIGWSNDYLDRHLDRVHQPSKPLPAGRVSAGGLAAGTIVALAVSFACGAALGAVPLLLLIGGTTAGLAYNLGVKDTRLSWLPYVVAFVLLPLFAWSAVGVFEVRFLALYPIALLLAPAGHIAQALPDVATDARAGRHGVVVALGRRRSLWLLAGCLALPPLLLGLSLPFLAFDHSRLAATLSIYALLLAGVAVAYGTQRDSLAFRLVSLAGLTFVVGGLAAL